MTGVWRPIAEHDGSDMLVDLWRDGERLTDYRLMNGRRWEAKIGYPVVTRVLTKQPTHFMVVPVGPA